MSLRDRLNEILPDLLPESEEEALKGKELIARVRAVLGEAYSDQTLRSQFSFMALEPDSCLARVPNGQGYYRRRPGENVPLQNLFGSGAEALREGRDSLHKALSLVVRLYDTAGMGVFVYPVEGEESWGHPDLVAVQWPEGALNVEGAYLMEKDAPSAPAYRAVCVCFGAAEEELRRSFFRALSCGLWAQETELLVLSEEVAESLVPLASRFGVGVRSLAMSERALHALPRADEIFRMGADEARTLLSAIEQVTLAHPHCRVFSESAADALPDTCAVRAWVEQCVARGRVEAYEQRVAVR